MRNPPASSRMMAGRTTTSTVQPSKDVLRPWKPERQNIYLLRKATIVDVLDGRLIYNQDVWLKNGLISSISLSSATRSIEKEGVREIDLTGKYLCPGLIDAHVHLTAVPGEKDLGDLFTLDTQRGFMRQPYVCQQMLRRGFTSVRDCGGASLALKQAIEENIIQGPRLFIAGRALSQTGGHGDVRGPHNHHSSDCCGGTVIALARVCDGVADCLKAAREELRTGADFIKIMAGGGVASPTDRLENVQFTAEEVRAISECARNSNTYVTAHAYTSRSVRHAIDNGATGIEHGNLIDEATARYMAEKGVFLTPTLITYSAMASPEYPGFLPDESNAKNGEVLRAGLRALKIASKAGVTLCFGTDLLGPLGVAQSKEFGLRAQALQGHEVLKSATVNPARMFGQAEFLGQIKEGFAADLIVLNQDPLKNIEILDTPEKHVLAIFKEGRVFHSRWSKVVQDVLPRDENIE
ncbi:amidohydrolase [Phlyctema vagabunda]|uniref:Amidohydrolase n=1 Tax=Phlyctema vagabunda TaxID=108571 RepID=A0ABR4P3S6_9HELO